MHELLTWLGVLGIPSIFSIACFCVKACVSHSKKINILMKAQQAQMRTKLLELYHVYEAQGYVTDEQITDWLNQYESYHALGQNGVLDARKEYLLKLPSKEVNVK